MDNSSINSPALVLIVDDESFNRKLLDTLLKAKGYATLTCECGKEALSLASKWRPDIILLDIMMPEMDGFEVARCSIFQSRDEPERGLFVSHFSSSALLGFVN